MQPNSARKLAYRLFSESVQQQFVAFLASMIRSIVSREGFLPNCFLVYFADLFMAQNSSWGLQSSLPASYSSEQSYCDILFSSLLLIYYYKNKSRALIYAAFSSQLVVLEPLISLLSFPSPTSNRNGLKISPILYFLVIHNTRNLFPKLKENQVKHPQFDLHQKSSSMSKLILYCDSGLKFCILLDAQFQNIFCLFLTLAARRLSDIHIFAGLRVGSR